MNERHEFEALGTIVDPGTGKPAYLAGQGVHEQVVADWGLRVGDADDDEAQVRSLRPRQMERPAGNASRDDWLRYRASQPGADQAALDEMGRDALRDMDQPADDGSGDDAKPETEE